MKIRLNQLRLDKKYYRRSPELNLDIAESIWMHGLQVPIVVVHDPKVDLYYVVDGGRRLLALLYLAHVNNLSDIWLDVDISGKVGEEITHVEFNRLKLPKDFSDITLICSEALEYLAQGEYDKVLKIPVKRINSDYEVCGFVDVYNAYKIMLASKSRTSWLVPVVVVE